MPHFMESPLDGGNALCGSLRGNVRAPVWLAGYGL